MFIVDVLGTVTFIIFDVLGTVTFIIFDVLGDRCLSLMF